MQKQQPHCVPGVMDESNYAAIFVEDTPSQALIRNYSYSTVFCIIFIMLVNYQTVHVQEYMNMMTWNVFFIYSVMCAIEYDAIQRDTVY